jgi:hypothetical protein
MYDASIGQSAIPEISRFYGIVIRMFYDEHEQPHFHATYQGEVVQIGIDPLTVMRGRSIGWPSDL